MAGMSPRLTVAAIGIPITAWLIYLGGWYLGVLMAAVAGLSAANKSELKLQPVTLAVTGMT